LRISLAIALLLFATSAFARPIPVKLIDLSTFYTAANGNHWTAADYPFAEQALTIQMQAVAKYYDAGRGFAIIGFDQPGAANWRVYIQNQCVSAGQSYAAYHWTDPVGPYACIASNGGGGYWWMTRAMEHELTEMAGDPSGRGREIVDPVAQYFGVVTDGVFSFDYSNSAGTPFVDFLLPRKARAQGFADYLRVVPVEIKARPKRATLPLE
jgi:hypothetical protein